MSITTSSHASSVRPCVHFVAAATTASSAASVEDSRRDSASKSATSASSSPCSTLLFGLGVLLYMTFWLVLTRSGEEHSIIQRIFLNRREAQFVLVAFIVTLF